MDINKRHKNTGNFWNSKIVLVLFVLLAIFLGNSALKMYSRSSETEKYYKAVDHEFVSLESRYESVTKDLEYIKSNTGLERELRSKFDLAKEGEKAILIIEEEIPPLPEARKRTIWERIVNWVSS